MIDSDQNNIRSARPSNIARVIFSLIFLTIYFVFDYPILLYFCIVNFLVSVSWFWIIEKRFQVYKKNPDLWFIPASIDIFFITVSVYFSGLSFSPALLAYVYSTATSSVDLIKKRGLFATFGNCISFTVILLLTKLNIIPYINIVNPEITGITMFSAVLSVILVVVACTTANSVIYQIYFQFNEKNNELNDSLDKIYLLKLQQDADYALTAKLMEPFGGNFLKSKSIQAEFLLEQKKSFQFKNQTLEIGGDLLIADELYFDKRKYVLILNADAMGKSMQGACGVLVLGVISKSIIANAHANNNMNLTPSQWIINAATEMHRIFESFDGFMLASMFLGLIEEESGNFYFLNAEHPSAILYRDEKASFLPNDLSNCKIGTMGIQNEFNKVEDFQLKAGDSLFIGSDGKDDIILKPTVSSGRSINQDEFLFSKIIEKTKGSLIEIRKEMRDYGELSDDLSIMKISISPIE